MNDNSIELPTVQPLVQQVDALRAQGLSIKQACKKLGRACETYYDARKASGIVHRHRKSEAEKRAMVAKVDQLRAQGVKVKKACKQVGVLDPTYYTWKNQFAGANPIPTLDEKRSLVARVDALRARGLEASEACEQTGGLKVYKYYRFAQQVRRAKVSVELQPAPQPPEVATVVVDRFHCPGCGLNQTHINQAYQAISLGNALTNGSGKRFQGLAYCCGCGFDLRPAMKVMAMMGDH